MIPGLLHPMLLPEVCRSRAPYTCTTLTSTAPTAPILPFVRLGGVFGPRHDLVIHLSFAHIGQRAGGLPGRQQRTGIVDQDKPIVRGWRPDQLERNAGLELHMGDIRGRIFVASNHARAPAAALTEVFDRRNADARTQLVGPMDTWTDTQGWFMMAMGL